MIAEREGMSESSSRHFALFLTSLSSGAETKMFNGAYPYLAARKLASADDEDTSKPTPEAYRIVFKKWIFAPIHTIQVMADPIGVKHLFSQARADVALNILRPDKIVRGELEKLDANGDKKGYLRVARTIPGFYAHYFQACTSDYPQPSSRVIFSVSTDGMCLFLLNDSKASTMNGREEIVAFSFERIRRWKYVENEGVFAWEYFFGANSEGGRWVTLKTEQVSAMQPKIKNKNKNGILMLFWGDSLWT